MTEAQILLGIMQNDNRSWRYIYRSMKPGFASLIRNAYDFGETASSDIEDIFQDSCLVLMQKVKDGDFVLSREGALFSYLVQIGKNTAGNLARKRFGSQSTDEETPHLMPFLEMRGNIIPDIRKAQENEPGDISISEKQQSQDEFLDRAFDSMPDTCKTIFKKYYWDRKQMDEIADIIGFANEDSVKTKKSRCMKTFKEFAKKLLENEEFAEEAVRATVERAVLREVMNEEKVYAQTGVTMAALDMEAESEKDEE